MTYQEYNARRKAILSAYHDRRTDLPDMQSELAKPEREYESSHPTSTFDNWTERAEEALAKMKETHRKVKKDWAHAYIYDGKVKIRNGKMILATMSVLEARLLANEILSITNKQRRKRK